MSAPDPHDALPIHGFRGTPEEIERQWYEQVYRGRGDRMAQLTWRAVLMGSLLGGLLSLTNLYIGLKAGWGCDLTFATGLWATMGKSDDSLEIAGTCRAKTRAAHSHLMRHENWTGGPKTGPPLTPELRGRPTSQRSSKVL